MVNDAGVHHVVEVIGEARKEIIQALGIALQLSLDTEALCEVVHHLGILHDFFDGNHLGTHCCQEQACSTSPDADVEYALAGKIARQSVGSHELRQHGDVAICHSTSQKHAVAEIVIMTPVELDGEVA